MPTRSPSAARALSTPAGGLAEAKLHQVTGYQIAQASIVTYGVFAQRVGQPLGLRPVEYTVLALVQENPGGSPAQLSSALAVTRPNITAWVDRLVARGLVARERNDADKRAQRLHTTEQGAALAIEATRALAAGEREALAALSQAERFMLIELLHKVACIRAEPELQRPATASEAQGAAGHPRRRATAPAAQPGDAARPARAPRQPRVTPDI